MKSLGVGVRFRKETGEHGERSAKQNAELGAA